MDSSLPSCPFLLPPSSRRPPVPSFLPFVCVSPHRFIQVYPFLMVREHSSWPSATLHTMPYCLRCGRSFSSNRAFEQHVSDSDSHHVCHECQKDCASAQGLHDHRRQKHLTCIPCKRVFQNGHDLAVHVRSSIHQPKSLCCPSGSCTRTFHSLGALMNHIESHPHLAVAGRDFEGMNRSTMYASTVVDYSNAMSSGLNDPHTCTPTLSLLETGHMFMPSSATVTTTSRDNNKKVFASIRSWNGSKYECVLCHKTFMSLSSLNKHLGSRVHQTKVYRCPRERGHHGCGKKFPKLGMLLDHVELEECGVLRFKKQSNDGGVRGVTTAMSGLAI